MQSKGKTCVSKLPLLPGVKPSQEGQTKSAVLTISQMDEHCRVAVNRDMLFGAFVKEIERYYRSFQTCIEDIDLGYIRTLPHRNQFEYMGKWKTVAGSLARQMPVIRLSIEQYESDYRKRFKAAHASIGKKNKQLKQTIRVINRPAEDKEQRTIKRGERKIPKNSLSLGFVDLNLDDQVRPEINRVLSPTQVRNMMQRANIAKRYCSSLNQSPGRDEWQNRIMRYHILQTLETKSKAEPSQDGDNLRNERFQKSRRSAGLSQSFGLPKLLQE